jgi:hypothetical protein
MPTEAESFLTAEEAVAKLLDNLESLKKEMEVYKTNRIQLVSFPPKTGQGLKVH